MNGNQELKDRKNVHGVNHGTGAKERKRLSKIDFKGFKEAQINHGRFVMNKLKELEARIDRIESEKSAKTD